MPKVIPVGKSGLKAIVDDSWFDLLILYKWNVVTSKSGLKYAQRRWREGSRLRGQLMHRMVLGIADGDSNQVDHKNGNTLDNRRNNLRSVTNSENKANRISKQGKSRYRGVTLDKDSGKFKASIGKNNKHINIGRFKTEMEAALAYDKRALELFGEFAVLNFPGKDSSNRCNNPNYDKNKTD